MLVPTLIMAGLASTLVFFGYYRGEGHHIAGMQVALRMMVQMLPLLLFALVVAGMIQVLASQQQGLVSKWLGSDSGIRGILIGSVVGSLTPGGPIVTVPIAAGLLRSGVGVGAVVAFLAGWGAWSVGRLPLEVGILGWKFTLIRIASVLLLPPIAGLIAQTFFGESK